MQRRPKKENPVSNGVLWTGAAVFAAIGLFVAWRAIKAQEPLTIDSGNGYEPPISHNV